MYALPCQLSIASVELSSLMATGSSMAWQVEAVNPEPAVAAGNAVEQAAALKAAVEAKLQEILPAIRGLGR